MTVPPKAQILPDRPLKLREGGERIDLRVSPMLYRQYGRLPPRRREDGGSIDASVILELPSCLSADYLDEADDSDPLNQLRVLCASVGDEFGVRLVFSDVAADEHEVIRLGLMAFLMLGVSHAEEIRLAIEKARAEPEEEAD